MDGAFDDGPEGRLVYVPRSSRDASRARSASAGRIRSMSATYSPRAEPFGASAPIPAQRPASAYVSGSPVRVHVQAMVKNRTPEALADDLMQSKEEVYRLKDDQSKEEVYRLKDDQSKEEVYRLTDDQKMMLVEKRRLEAELAKTKNALAKTGDMLYQKERLTHSGNNMSMSQLYRTPDTTHLVANLKEQNRELRSGRDSSAEELALLQRSMQATKVSELQSEIFTGMQEMERLQRINRIIGERLAAAEDAAHAAAHKALMSQAQLLGAVFMPMSMPELVEKARERPSTAGAPEVLNFLQNHVQKLGAELAGQPGMASPRPVSAASSSSTTASSVKFTKHYQLMEGVTKALWKLKNLQPADFETKPELQLSASQLQDLFKVYSAEVDRLRGEEASPPKSTSPRQNVMLRSFREKETTPPPSPLPPTSPPAEEAPVSPLPSVAEEAPLFPLPFIAEEAPISPPPPSGKEAPADEAPVSPPTPSGEEAVAEEAPISLPPSPLPPPGSIPYAVVIEPILDAAVSGSVYVTFRGENGSSSSEVLLPAAAADDDVSNNNALSVMAEDVGAVRSVDIRMEAAGNVPAGSGSFLKGITVSVGAFTTSFEINDLTLVDYEVEVYTADCAGAGTDGNVSVKVVGDMGATAWVQLGALVPAADAFSRGCCDKFRIRGADVNDLSHLMIKLAAVDGGSGVIDGRALHSSWNLTRAEPIVTLAEADTWVAKTPYAVTVLTSEAKGADFEGEVFITFKGMWGSSSETKLVSAGGSSSYKFQNGASDMFSVMSDDIGSVSAVVVRYVPGAGSNDVWGLSKLIINPEVWWGGDLVFDGWLTEQNPECTVYKWRDAIEYKMVAFTSNDVTGAAYDGDVYLILTGEFGSTNEQLLLNDTYREGPVGNPKTLYSPETPQEFTLKATDVGCLASVSLRVVATGTTDSWSVDRIQVTLSTASDAPAELIVHKDWVRADAVSSVLINKLLIDTEYKVKVCSSVESDPFDGDLYLTLAGVEGSASEVRLSNNVSGNFHPGVVADFSMTAGSVGTITGATVRIATTGSVPWWLMKQIEVTTTKSGAVSFFRYNSWMHADNSSVVTLQPQTLFEYTVTLKMMDDGSGGGSGRAPYDGCVTVIVHGDTNSSDPVSFSAEKGCGDLNATVAQSSATIKCSDLGSLSFVRVKTSGASVNNTLHLDRVEVQNISTGASACYFPCKAALGDEEDTTVSLKAMKHYRATEKLMNGSFDGGLSLLLCGSEGDSEPVALVFDTTSGPLSAGSEEECSIDVYDVGDFEAIKLVVAQSGESTVISVDRVRLLDTSTYVNQSFFLGGDIQAPGFATLQKMGVVEYAIQVMTGDHRGAGTDGLVYLSLKGDKGRSDSIMLERSSESSFEQGGVDRMVISTTDVGKLESALISMRPRNWWDSTLHSEWMMDGMRVLDTSTGERTTFKLNGWVAAEEVEVLVATTEQVYVGYQVVVTGAWSSMDCDAEIKLHSSSNEESDVPPSTMKLLRSAALQNGLATTFNVQGADVPSMVAIEFTPLTTWSINVCRIEVLNKKTKASGLFKFTDSQNVYPSDCPKRVEAAAVDTSYTAKLCTIERSGHLPFEGKIFITLHGEEGACEEQELLGGWSTSSQSGTINDFYISGYSVGPIKAITMRTEKGLAQTPEWGLGYVEVVNQNSSAQALFEFQDFIKAGSSALIECSKVEVEYEVCVTTSDVRGAGTDANVFVTISGECGSLDEVMLSSQDSNLFARGGVNKFTLNGLDVGANCSFAIRLGSPISDDGENAAIKSQWSLATVELLNKNTGIKSVFSHNSWITTTSAVTELSKTSSMQALRKYEVSVSTGDLPGSEYQGDAWITISGYRGTTEEMKLVLHGHTHSSFQRGITEEFVVRGLDVGYVCSVALRMMPTESNPNWFVEKLVVKDSSAGNSNPGSFEASSWLDEDKKELTIQRDQPLIEYKVEVYSSNVGGAGFDGEAEIVLHGQHGSTDDKGLVDETFTFPTVLVEEVEKTPILPAVLVPILSTGLMEKVGEKPILRTGLVEEVEEKPILRTDLVNKMPTFPPGSCKTFFLKVADIGVLSYIDLRAKKTGKVSSWSLDRLVISEVVDGGRSWPFLDKDTDSGTAAPVLITAIPPGQPDVVTSLKRDVPLVDYKVVVSTTDLPGVGFDGSLYIQLSGADSMSEEVQLMNPTLTKFLPGGSNAFTVTLPAVGKFMYMMMRPEFCGTSILWHLGKVTITDIATDDTSNMNYGSYVTPSTGAVYLYPQSIYTWKAIVHTSPQSDASFDGSLFITLSSPWEQGEERELSNKMARFDAGSEQVFTFKLGSISHVGHVDIRVVATGTETKWHLAFIELTCVETETGFVFSLHDWVSADADVPVRIEGQTLSLYDLTLVTAADSEPFNGSAFLTLVGSNGEAEEVRIPLPEGYIRAGDVSKVLGLKLGKPAGSSTGFRFRTTGNSSSSWHLASATLMLTHADTSELFLFRSAIPAGGTSTAIRLEDVTYDFVLTTADVRGNGTDADAVRVVLTGEKGSSQQITLRDYSDHFLDCGSVTTISALAPDLGKLLSLLLWLGDGKPESTVHAPWLPEKLQVIDTRGGERTTFMYEEKSWLTKAPAGDAGTKLVASATDNVFIEYKLTVHTSKECAGFDGDIELRLVGEDGKESHTLMLGRAAKGGLFRPGASDALTVQVVDFGTPASIKVNINETGESHSWMLACIELLNSATGGTGVYKCSTPLTAWNSWTSISITDGLDNDLAVDGSSISINQIDTSASIAPTVEIVEYKVVVFTSDLADAGFNDDLTDSGVNGDLADTGFNGDLTGTGFNGNLTDTGVNGDLTGTGFNGEVFLALYHSDGDQKTTELPLLMGGDNPAVHTTAVHTTAVHTTAGSQEFIVKAEEISDIGSISIRIEGGQAPFGPPWGLDRVEVTNLSKAPQSTAVFYHQADVNKDSVVMLNMVEALETGDPSEVADVIDDLVANGTVVIDDSIATVTSAINGDAIANAVQMAGEKFGEVEKGFESLAEGGLQELWAGDFTKVGDMAGKLFSLFTEPGANKVMDFKDMQHKVSPAEKKVAQFSVLGQIVVGALEVASNAVPFAAPIGAVIGVIFAMAAAQAAQVSANVARLLKTIKAVDLGLAKATNSAMKGQSMADEVVEYFGCLGKLCKDAQLLFSNYLSRGKGVLSWATKMLKSKSDQKDFDKTEKEMVWGGGENVAYHYTVAMMDTMASMKQIGEQPPYPDESGILRDAICQEAGEKDPEKALTKMVQRGDSAKLTAILTEKGTFKDTIIAALIDGIAKDVEKLKQQMKETQEIQDKHAKELALIQEELQQLQDGAAKAEEEKRELELAIEKVRLAQEAELKSVRDEQEQWRLEEENKRRFYEEERDKKEKRRDELELERQAAAERAEKAREMQLAAQIALMNQQMENAAANQLKQMAQFALQQAEFEARMNRMTEEMEQKLQEAAEELKRADEKVLASALELKRAQEQEKIKAKELKQAMEDANAAKEQASAFSPQPDTPMHVAELAVSVGERESPRYGVEPDMVVGSEPYEFDEEEEEEEESPSYGEPAMLPEREIAGSVEAEEESPSYKEPAMMAEEGPSGYAEVAPAMMAEEGPSGYAEAAPAMMAEEGPSDYEEEEEEESPSYEEPAMMAERESPAMMAERESPAMMAERESPAMMAERESPAMMADEVAPDMMAERESPAMMAERESPAMMAEEGPSDYEEEEEEESPSYEEPAMMAEKESSDYAVAAPDMMAQEEARAPSMIADEVAPDMMAERESYDSEEEEELDYPMTQATARAS
eukprot:gene8862-3748_t